MIPEELADYIEGGSLNQICAFRMAAKDLRNGDLGSAVYRMRSDRDKLVGKDRELVDYFIKNQASMTK